MKIRTELSEEFNDEIIIRCKNINDNVLRLQKVISDFLGDSLEIALTFNGKIFFIPYGKILFFETDFGRTVAHTADGMFSADTRLCELERSLPYSFIRVSKSCILNSALVSSISKNLTGASEVTFTGSQKVTYVSRMYYKALIERINETRLKK